MQERYRAVPIGVTTIDQPCTNWNPALPGWEKNGKTKGDMCGIVVVAQGSKAQKDETEVSSFFVGEEPLRPVRSTGHLPLKGEAFRAISDRPYLF